VVKVEVKCQRCHIFKNEDDLVGLSEGVGLKKIENIYFCNIVKKIKRIWTMGVRSATEFVGPSP
jgi:hypothetical protein